MIYLIKCHLTSEMRDRDVVPGSLVKIIIFSHTLLMSFKAAPKIDLAGVDFKKKSIIKGTLLKRYNIFALN